MVKREDSSSVASSTEHLSLEDIVHITNKIGMEYVAAKKEAEKKELLKATYRARAMERHDDGLQSEAKIRRLAELDQEYIDFLSEIVELRHKVDQLRIRYDSYKNLFEARRSLLSYKKAEMKLL